MDDPGLAFVSFRTVFPVILIAMVVIWQFALEPRVAYFRNRGDYFNKRLIKAKFLFTVGFIFISLSSFILPIGISFFSGMVFVFGGMWYLHQALALRSEADR